MQAKLRSEGPWQVNMAVGCFYKHNALKICVCSTELRSTWQVPGKSSFPPFTICFGSCGVKESGVGKKCNGVTLLLNIKEAARHVRKVFGP